MYNLRNRRRNGNSRCLCGDRSVCNVGRRQIDRLSVIAPVIAAEEVHLLQPNLGVGFATLLPFGVGAEPVAEGSEGVAENDTAMP